MHIKYNARRNVSETVVCCAKYIFVWNITLQSKLIYCHEGYTVSNVESQVFTANTCVDDYNVALSYYLYY